MKKKERVNWFTVKGINLTNEWKRKIGFIFNYLFFISVTERIRRWFLIRSVAQIRTRPENTFSWNNCWQSKDWFMFQFLSGPPQQCLCIKLNSVQCKSINKFALIIWYNFDVANFKLGGISPTTFSVVSF